MKILAVGHATFRIELNGRVIFTDPWFTTSGILYNLFARRVFPLALKPDFIHRCDAMLVSHAHLDHVSKEAFRVARRLNSLIVGPGEVIRRARRWGIETVRELRAGETMNVDGIAVTGVPAFHPLSRNPVGFLMEGERKVYFSGDTRFDWSIVGHLRRKPIDVALLQTSCAFYSWWNGADGMDLNYAEELARAIRPKYFIPIHFDCVGKYLDISGKVRVNEHNLNVEDCLEHLRERLFKHGITCVILYSGNSVEL
jgi:L-ascorbate metabolism protein UlaG (beta-lactamase superfamily)